MVLEINFKSGKPIHVQIVDQVRAAADSGALRPGEALPAIGPLALELRVNRNAIAKAYAELESLGLVETALGKGHVLKDSRSPLRNEARRKLLVAEVDLAIAEAPTTVRKTLTYALMTAVLAGIYFGLVVLIVRTGIAPREWSAILSAVIVAAVFIPVRTRVGHFVDRFVYAKRYEFPRTLQAIRAAAVSEPDLNGFASRVTEQAEAVLEGQLEWIRDYSALLALADAFPSLRSTRTPVSSGVDLLMPVVSNDELSAVLRLSGRPDGMEYDSEDREFLIAVGEQVAIAANQFRSRKERQEGEFALDIQQGLLPREIPQIPGFTLAGAWQPARVVGGDYYDVFRLGETTLALVLGDVCGKGIPAALLMANLQATVKAYAMEDASPKELCEKVNRAVSGSTTTGRFITFFYAVLDSTRRRLTYVNAGHNPPLIARQDVPRDLKLESGGPVLGVFPDAVYEEGVIDLLPGDRLAIFTDGITEAADSGGDEFGEERLMSILRTPDPAAATELRDAIMRGVARFCREDFADDATLLTLVVE